MGELLGQDADKSRRQFEKAFTTTAEQAAKTILAGVRRDSHRVLIGADALLRWKRCSVCCRVDIRSW